MRFSPLMNSVAEEKTCSLVSRSKGELRSRLLIGLGVALTFWGFLEIADEIAEDDLRDVEASIMYAMRVPGDTEDPIGPLWLEEAARDVTSLGSFALLSIVAGGSVLFLALTGRGHAAGFVMLAVVSGVVLSSVLKSSFDRARPDLIAHQMHTLTKSFPSGHALLSAVVYLTLGSLVAVTQPRRRVKLFLISASVSLTMLVGVTRIYLGVHWPTDVIGGWFLGASWALAWWLVALRFLPRNERP